MVYFRQSPLFCSEPDEAIRQQDNDSAKSSFYFSPLNKIIDLYSLEVLCFSSREVDCIGYIIKLNQINSRWLPSISLNRVVAFTLH